MFNIFKKITKLEEKIKELEERVGIPDYAVYKFFIGMGIRLEADDVSLSTLLRKLAEKQGLELVYIKGTETTKEHYKYEKIKKNTKAK